MRSGSGQHRLCAESTVHDGVIAIGTTTDDVETGWSGINVQASHAEGMVVVPNGRGAVFIRILENSESWTPGRAKLVAALPLKKLYHVPSEAKPIGILLAAGRYQASA
jgi:hypothetical protein